jgi:hypothetical protein
MCEYALYARGSDAVSDGRSAMRSSRRGITYPSSAAPGRGFHFFRHKRLPEVAVGS